MSQKWVAESIGDAQDCLFPNCRVYIEVLVVWRWLSVLFLGQIWTEWINVAGLSPDVLAAESQKAVDKSRFRYDMALLIAASYSTKIQGATASIRGSQNNGIISSHLIEKHKHVYYRVMHNSVVV